MEILNLINKKFNNKYDYLRVLRVEYDTLLSYVEVIFLNFKILGIQKLPSSAIGNSRWRKIVSNLKFYQRIFGLCVENTVNGNKRKCIVNQSPSSKIGLKISYRFFFGELSHINYPQFQSRDTDRHLVANH